MKKIISILLLSGLLLTSFSGCALFGQQDENPTEEPVVLPKQQADQDDLIVNLVAYLDSLNDDINPLPTSVERKINLIKDERFVQRAVHVEIDPSSCYFVCGYYNTEHDKETSWYCCAADYTWVKFENANEIQEYCNGEKMIVAFQINEASFVKDIISCDVNVLGFSHFQLYETQFIDGFNINASDNLDKTFISLFHEMMLYEEQIHRNYIYHSIGTYNNDWGAFLCVYREDKCYILIELYVIGTNGHRAENDLTQEFGEYYDILMPMLQTDEEYSVTYEAGYTRYYGLIPMDDFVDAVLK